MSAPAPPTIIGRYAVYGKIASGGMASVHFGRLVGAAGFARTVAIKRLHPHLAEDPDFRLTLVDEARMAARIQHPNVVAMLDVASTGGELLLVMEYVRGESLGRLLRAVRAAGQLVPLSIVSAITIGALRGLHAAHEAVDDTGAPLGIVHRDVSPQNILVGADGVSRLIDFGIAKATGRLQTTREGVLKGKLEYMAPEQLGSRGLPISRRTDVYATAVVLWEAIAARGCFRTEEEAKTYALILAGAREPPSRHRSGLPRGLDDVVMKGMSIDPDRRFPTALDMAEALQGVLQPAFPNEVGAWVEQMAYEALAARAAAVADIERSSASGPVPLPEGFTTGDRDDATTNVASQPSSLSVETLERGRTSMWARSARLSTWHAVALAAVSVVVGGVAALMLRGPGSAESERDPGASAGAGSVAATASVTESPPTEPSASASAAAPADASDSTPAFSPRRGHPHRSYVPSPPPGPPAPPAPAATPSNDVPLSHERL